MIIASEQGGKMILEYETFRLKANEYFLVIIDAEVVLQAKAEAPFEDGGVYSSSVTRTVEFPLKKGNHLLQLSVESRIAP